MDGEDATNWCKRQVLARVRFTLEDQARRHTPVLTSTPWIPSTGVDAGPWWGPSVIPDTTARDQETTFQGYLDAGNLMVNSPLDYGLTRKMVAHYAIYLVCRSQIGRKSDTPYMALAKEYRSAAIRMLLSWVARIDINADGVAEYEVRG